MHTTTGTEPNKRAGGEARAGANRSNHGSHRVMARFTQNQPTQGTNSHRVRFATF